MSITTVSVAIAAASVVAASTYYSFMVRHQARIRKTDLLMKLYATWDSLEFQGAFHSIYWADFHDYDGLLESLRGRLQVASYVCAFYDQVGALLRRKLIDFELADDLLGNSTTQLWAKIEPVIREARTRSDDPRLYEHFEYLNDEMTRRMGGTSRPNVPGFRLSLPGDEHRLPGSNGTAASSAECDAGTRHNARA